MLFCGPCLFRTRPLCGAIGKLLGAKCRFCLGWGMVSAAFTPVQLPAGDLRIRDPQQLVFFQTCLAPGFAVSHPGPVATGSGQRIPSSFTCVVFLVYYLWRSKCCTTWRLARTEWLLLARAGYLHPQFQMSFGAALMIRWRR